MPSLWRWRPRFIRFKLLPAMKVARSVGIAQVALERCGTRPESKGLVRERFGGEDVRSP